MVWSYLELHVDDHSVLAERLVLHHQGVNTTRQGSHSLLLSCVSFIFTFSHPHILIRHSIEFRRSIRISSSIFPFVYHTFDLSHSCVNILFQIGLCNIGCVYLHLRVVLVRFVQVKSLQRFSTS